MGKVLPPSVEAPRRDTAVRWAVVVATLLAARAGLSLGCSTPAEGDTDAAVGTDAASDALVDRSHSSLWFTAADDGKLTRWDWPSKTTTAFPDIKPWSFSVANDGNRIAFTRPGKDLFVVDGFGHGERIVASGVSAFALSADGARLAWTEDGAVRLMTGDGVSMVLEPGGAQYVSFLGPSGRYLMVTGTEQLLFDLSSGTPKRSVLTAAGFVDGHFLGDGGVPGVDAIEYGATKSYVFGSASGQVLRARIDGTSPFGYALPMAWPIDVSLDGGRVAYGLSNQVHLTGEELSGGLVIDSPYGSATKVRLSPAGDRVAYLTNSFRGRDLWMSTGTKNMHVLLAKGTLEDVAWSPDGTALAATFLESGFKLTTWSSDPTQPTLAADPEPDGSTLGDGASMLLPTGIMPARLGHFAWTLAPTKGGDAPDASPTEVSGDAPIVLPDAGPTFGHVWYGGLWGPDASPSLAVLYDAALSLPLGEGTVVRDFAVSRDGATLAVFGDLDTAGVFKLFRVDVKTGARTLLTAPAGGFTMLGFSPDGSTVTYIDAAKALVSIPSTSGPVTTLRSLASQYEWAPDSKHLLVDGALIDASGTSMGTMGVNATWLDGNHVLCGRGGGWNEAGPLPTWMVSHDITSGIETHVVAGAGPCIVAPDGTRIAQLVSSGLRSFDADGNALVYYGSDLKIASGSDPDCVFSPDGKFIACSVKVAGAPTLDVYVLPARSGGAKRVLPRPEYDWPRRSFAWSPRSDELVELGTDAGILARSTSITIADAPYIRLLTLPWTTRGQLQWTP